MLDKVIPTLWIRNDEKFYEEIKELRKNGIKKIRVNCTRHSVAEYIENITEFKNWCIEHMGYDMDIILDLPIPKRKARLYYQWKGTELHIKKGAYGYIGLEDNDENDLICNDAQAFKMISIDDLIIIGDHELYLTVVECRENRIKYRCVKEGTVTYGKYFTTRKVKYTKAEEKEILEYKKLIHEIKPFAVALSFVETEEEIYEIKKILELKDVQVISKIETAEAIRHIGNISRNSDAIMVGRGDLLINILPEEFAKSIDMILETCVKQGKDCYVASGFLSSMKNETLVPSRSELTDLYYYMIKCDTPIVLEYKICSNIDLIKRVLNLISGVIYGRK